MTSTEFSTFVLTTYNLRTYFVSDNVTYYLIFQFPFRLNYSLCSGRSRCFHATNVFLHAAATALVAAVCRRVLAARPGFAAAAASLFALHPVHTEAVSSRRDSQ